MKKNRWDVLGRVRRIKEKRARAALGGARLAQEQARQKLEELKSRLEGETAVERLTAQQLLVLQLQGIRDAELVTAAAEEYDKERRRADRKAVEWRKAAADADAADEMAARRREEEAREAGRIAERHLEDLLSMMRTRRVP